MIAFILGLIVLTIYLLLKSDKTGVNRVDVFGLCGILFIIWGTSRYVGSTPKPIWDPN